MLFASLLAPPSSLLAVLLLAASLLAAHIIAGPVNPSLLQLFAPLANNECIRQFFTHLQLGEEIRVG